MRVDEPPTKRASGRSVLDDLTSAREAMTSSTDHLRGTSRDPSGSHPAPSSRRNPRLSAHARLAMRIVAVLVVALVTLAFVYEYLEGRRADEWNYQANLWMASVSAAIGIVGWVLPRLVAWIMLPFAALWLVLVLLYSGFLVAGLVVGGLPLAVALLLFFSATPRRAGDCATATTGDVETGP